MRQAALLVALVCVVAVPVAGAVGATGGQSAVQQDDLVTNGTEISIHLQPNGDARWNVSARYELDDENDTAAFGRVAERFKAGETDNGFSIGVFRAAAPQVSEQVGREMEIRDDHRTATQIDNANNSTGVLTLQFTWTNFTQVDNETLVVDSFAGSWFGDLRGGQTLTIRPPEGYDTQSVQPAHSTVGGAYQWVGPQAFEDGEPVAEFAVAGSGNSFTFDSVTMVLLGVGGAVVLLGGIVAWTYVRRQPPWSDTGDDELPASGEEAAAGATAGAAGSGTTSGDGGDAAIDPELLSDEERVERLLREHGGRMKQSKIVEETRWSTAKVSQLLSAMDDEGRIEKLRIGRENLISLPGEGVNDE
ncbi:DUF7345 domain-containing protein [Halobacterium wangiae]|uniref:DUF7345 domain-containing protein n=1 Tax=Halobacterium wangiae TaxID=2902623 RepID=UPI001E643B7C|nr:hypothetical protein [Halobacterium wangiae]